MPRALRLLACLALAGCAGPPPPPAPAEARDGRVFHAALDNGLRVVLCPDPSVPRVAAKLSFRVSYRDDPPGREGLGWPAFVSVAWADRDAWVHRIEACGGWWDPTNIYPEVRSQDMVVHARDLGVVVGVMKEILEATDPGDPRALAPYRQGGEGLVRRLRKRRASNLLDREGFEEPFASNDPVGLGSCLDGLSEEAFLAFRSRHFAPARAQVTLVGAFPPAATLEALARELGGIPNPPGVCRDPATLRAFRPGFKVVEEEASDPPGIGLRLAYPIPDGIASVEAHLLAELLEDHLQGLEGAEALVVSADGRAGQRLLRIGLAGDPERLLPRLEERLAAFPGAITDEGVGKAALALRHRLALGPPARLQNIYWLSWAVAFETEPLGRGWQSPWHELERLPHADAASARALAEGILVPPRRLVVASAFSAEDAARLRAAFAPRLAAVPSPAPGLSGPDRFPDHPPPPPDPPARTAYLAPGVRTLAGGRILFVEDPARPWYALKGFYPVGALERGTRAYAAALEASRPGEGEERPFLLEASEAALAFRLQVPCWTQEDLMAWVEKARAWLATPPAAEAGESPMPALEYLWPGGPRPAWVLMVRGPRPVPALEALDLPGAPPAAPPAVRRAFSPDQLAAPAEAPLRILVPLDGLEEASLRAVQACLEAWLDPQSRVQQQYGPFTLPLPALAHPPDEAGSVRVGREAFLVLGFREGKAEDLLAWVRSGLQTASLREDPASMENLRGHALSSLMGRFSADALGALLVNAAAATEGGGDPAWADRTDEALRRLTADQLIETASRWLKAACVAGVPKAAP